MGGPEYKVAIAQQARAYCNRHRIASPYRKSEQASIERFIPVHDRCGVMPSRLVLLNV